MTRVTFGGHAGAVHSPAGPARLAVVLCPPVGREGRMAYRPLWQFANLLADHGIAVLRYDHLGTGDSLPLESEADQWSGWRAGVAEAAAFARAHLGAERLVLAGLRLGASLATVAAETIRPDGLLLMAPVLSGKVWVREQRIAAAMLRGGGEPAGAPPSGLDADGLTLSAATIAALQTFDLRKTAPAGEIFVACPDAATRLPPAWSIGEIAPFEGFDTLFQEAHVNAPPRELFGAACAWAQRLAGPSAAAAALPPARLQTSEWVERPITFGDGLRGILCLPRGGASRRAVAMGNTGGDPRAGIGEFGAKACRALAARGVAALRFDFAGLGESDGAGEAWRSHVYEQSRAADFDAAVERLADEGYAQVILAGVCSGAHHAVHAAIANPGISAVFAINTAKLVWRPGDTLALSTTEAVAAQRGSLRALRRAETWWRILKGEAPLGRMLVARAAGLWRLTGLHRDAQSQALWTGLKRLCARGGQVRMLIGRGDSAHGELEAHFGWRGLGLMRLGQRARARILPGLDHGLFFAESREMALRELVDFALAVPTPRIAPSAVRTAPRPAPARAPRAGRLLRPPAAGRRLGPFAALS